MLKKRLIFTLHYFEGSFVLSRNFRIQKVGDLSWLKKNYNFINTAKYLDELIILNVRPNNSNKEMFAKTIKELSKDCFIPISAGGGIRSLEDAKLLLKNGADKIVINSAIEHDTKLVRNLGDNLGTQCVVGSIDFTLENDQINIFTKCGTKKLSKGINEYLIYLQKLPIGELYINSITKDGTGTGLDINFFNFLQNEINIPVIFSGGVGKWSHFYEGLMNKKIDAVSTANLFNFIADGIKISRKNLINNDINLPNFDDIFVK